MKVMSAASWAVAAAILAAGPLACEGEKGKAAQAPEKRAPAVAKAAKAGPSIACDQPEFDFGNVNQGEIMKHVFTLKNVGDDVLNILSARGG